MFARKATSGGTAPTLRAILRAFNPGTSTYTELGTANATITTEPTAAFASYVLTWTLASVSVPVGRQVEVKIVATGVTSDVDIAYDITANASSLTLP